MGENNSDIKIWNDFRNGESYALPHIYHKHVSLLFRYGKKFSQNDELIKDSIQDLFFDLIRTKQKLSQTDNINYYLFVAFRRKLVKNIKKHNSLLDPQTEFFLEAEIVYSIEQEIIDKEVLTHREKLVRKTLKELSPKQREILFYRFTCDFEYEQICEIMSLKYDSARKLVYRALGSLKKCLSDTDIFLLFLKFLPRKYFS